MSSQSWMSPRTNRTGSSPRSLSLRWGFRTIQQCSWYFPYVFPTKSIHASFAAAIINKSTWLQAKPDSWGFRKFISTDFLKSRASQWLPEDNLTIVCDVSIIGDILALRGFSGRTLHCHLFIVFPHIINFRGREDTFWVKVS